MTKIVRVVAARALVAGCQGRVPIDHGALGSLGGARPPAGLPLLNDDVFRRSATEPRALLIGTAPERPAVQTAVRDGKYHAAAVVYPASVAVDAVVAALCAKYGPSETGSVSGQSRWTLCEKGVSVVAQPSKGRVEVYLLAEGETQAFQDLEVARVETPCHRKHAAANAAHSGAPQASAMPRS